MGTEETRSIWALSPLLALALAACGGRYASVGDSGEGGTSSTGGPSTAGTSSGKPQPGAGGSTPAGMPGTGTGGAATGGGAPGIGGTFGVAGTSAAFGGTSTGSGGASPGLPASDVALCGAYCDTFTNVCPNEPGFCSKQCLSILSTLSGDCLATKRDGYACVAEAMKPGASCGGAKLVASKLCGGADGQPPDCAPPGDCDFEFQADPAGSGCSSVRYCANGTAELYCSNATGPLLCSCVVNGMVLSLMSGQSDPAAACLDQGLLDFCTAKLF